MDPNKNPSAPPPAWDSGEKSGMGQQPPPPAYQDYPQYPNAGMQGYPPPGMQGYPQPGMQGYPPPPQGVQGPPYGQYAPPGQSPLMPGQVPVAVQPTTVYVTRGPLQQPVKDYLGYSIFTMVCCCLPLGIAALVSSIAVRDANNQGNQEAAEKSSRRARNLNHAAVGIGITIGIIWIILTVLVKERDD